MAGTLLSHTLSKVKAAPAGTGLNVSPRWDWRKKFTLANFNFSTIKSAPAMSGVTK